MFLRCRGDGSQPPDRHYFLGFGQLASLAAGALAEVELSLRARLSFFALQPNVASVGLQFARFHVVIQETREDVLHDFVAQDRIFDWKGDLHAANEIPRHPIRARHVKHRLAAVLEIVNAAVLQEAPDNADDADVFAQAWDFWPET